MQDKFDRFISLLGTTGVVLDVGCGVGDNTQRIVESGFEAVGIDIDIEKIRSARLKFSNGIFRLMDARSLKYPDASFDGIWADTLLGHLSAVEVSQTINNFARVLKPGGVLYLGWDQSAAEAKHLKPSKDITLPPINLLTECGFKIVSQTDIQSTNETQNYHGNSIELFAIRSENLGYQQNEYFQENCLLCPDSRFRFNRQVGLPSSGSLLWGNESLYMMPDIAPLVEGHLLLSTTMHYMCYGACPPEMNPEIISMQRYVRELFADIYQTPTIFMEHGPAQIRKAGVCIDHAHWHCLPSFLPIQQTVEKLLGSGRDASLETLQEMYQAGDSYIYIENAPGEGRAYVTNVLPSQYLRQVTVSLLNRTDWEWQTTFKRGETQETYRRMLQRLIPAIDTSEL